MPKCGWKHPTLFLSLVFLLAFVSGCLSGSSDSSKKTTSSQASAASAGADAGDNNAEEDDSLDVAAALDENKEDHGEADDCTWDPADAFAVTLNGAAITVDDGAGAVVAGSVVTLSTAATYVITGTLDDGRIIVDTQDEETVRLVLNGANITCSTNSPLSVMNAEKTVIILADGSANTVTDGAAYPDEEEASGAVFSADDLSICGPGALTVNGNYNDGIACKDGLVIESGTILVNATADDGIRGKDYLVVRGGNITVKALGDGLKSDNEDEAERGYIYIENGSITVDSGEDALQAETDILIADGELNLTSGGGSTFVPADSAKGLKAGVLLIIEDGGFIIDSGDDAIHSNGSLQINGGAFVISTSDDGIHADVGIRITGGTFDILKCYEGIEAVHIVIDDGDISIISSDDGLNVAGGADGSGTAPGSAVSSDYYLHIHDGYIVIYATGDGLDANGYIRMTGGVVLVHGPTVNNNSAIDYDGSFVITGGFLAAAGSSGMDQAPGASSTQNSIRMTMSTAKAAGTLVRIQDSAGEDLLTFKPAKTFQSLVFSSPDLLTGATFTAYTGGTSTGVLSDGLYQGGTYTPGSLYGSFTIANRTTYLYH